MTMSACASVGWSEVDLVVFTHNVVHAERAGPVLEKPGVHTLLVELMCTRDDPQVLSQDGKEALLTQIMTGPVLKPEIEGFCLDMQMWQPMN